MTIREATVADIPAVAELAIKTYRDAFCRIYAPEDLERRLRDTRSEKYFAQTMKTNKVLVAEEGGLLVGYAEFGVADIAYPGITKDDMELHRLYVHEDYQRKGIGRALLDAAFAHPEMQGANRVFLDVLKENERAIRFYQNYGFTDTGSKDVEGDIIMMRKKN